MILTDSGFWVALGNRRDRYHDTARAALERWSGEGFITTWPVLTEVCHLLVSRVGVHPSLVFMDAVAKGACEVAELPENAPVRVAHLMRQYRNLPMDLADASLVLLAEHLFEGRILSTDRRDFDGDRWKNTRPFVNVLLGEF